MDPMAAAAMGIAGIGINEMDMNNMNNQNWSAMQAQMAFQERMSNTAYTRATTDMKNAGLNPGLMYGSGSGASTPSGSAAQAAAGAGNGSIINQAIGSAQQAKQLQLNDKKTQSDIATQAAQASAALASAKNSLSSAKKADQDTRVSAITEKKQANEAKLSDMFGKGADAVKDLFNWLGDSSSSKQQYHNYVKPAGSNKTIEFGPGMFNPSMP